MERSARGNVVLCAAREAMPAVRALETELIDALSRMPEIQFAVLPHLYDLTADGPCAAYLRGLSGGIVVIAHLPPRAAYWVLRAHGIDRARCLDLRNYSDARAVVNEILGAEQTERTSTAKPQAADPVRITEPAQSRWYPVIDQDRCSNCLECLNFCLFGVYGLDEAGRIIVESPDACRDGCPACARICPASAILFPECPDPAIAGGETAAEQDALDQLVDGLAASEL